MIPHLPRSTLHRCYQHHSISRLPDVEEDKPAKRKFKNYSIGYFHTSSSCSLHYGGERRHPSSQIAGNTPSITFSTMQYDHAGQQLPCDELRHGQPWRGNGHNSVHTGKKHAVENRQNLSSDLQLSLGERSPPEVLHAI
jgi:hypothetical protein